MQSIINIWKSSLHSLLNIYESKKEEKPAREFHMAYGWAILIVAGAIGAFSYFIASNFSLTSPLTGAFVNAPFTNNLKDNAWLIIIVFLMLSLVFYRRLVKNNTDLVVAEQTTPIKVAYKGNIHPNRYKKVRKKRYNKLEKEKKEWLDNILAKKKRLKRRQKRGKK